MIFHDLKRKFCNAIKNHFNIDKPGLKSGTYTDRTVDENNSILFSKKLQSLGNSCPPCAGVYNYKLLNQPLSSTPLPPTVNLLLTDENGLDGQNVICKEKSMFSCRRQRRDRTQGHAVLNVTLEGGVANKDFFCE